MRIPFFSPAPAPKAVYGNDPLPLKNANPLSKLFYHWCSPLFKAGYSRPLETDDLWYLTDDLRCKAIADRLEAHFLARLPPSRRGQVTLTPIKDEKPVQTGKKPSNLLEAPTGIDDSVSKEETRRSSRPDIVLDDSARIDGQIGDEIQRMASHRSDLVPVAKAIHEPEVDNVKRFGKRKAKKLANGDLVFEDNKMWDMSLWKAIFLCTFRPWCKCVLWNVGGQALKVTTPLVVKRIINYLTTGHAYDDLVSSGSSLEGVSRPRSVGYGIGSCVALFAMIVLSNLLISAAYFRANLLGLTMRTAVIDAISRKSMKLSGKARNTYTTGRINTTVSTDASYLDWVFPATPDLVVSPIIIIVGAGLLIAELGYSVLVGLGLLIAVAPLQGWLFAKIMRFRRLQSGLVDERVRHLTEIIGSVRAVKLYAYEKHFAEKISKMRDKEHAKLWRYGFLRSSVNGFFFVAPIAATILTFITYALSGHDLDPGSIFAALALFNVLTSPIQVLPMQVSAVMDSLSGVGRIAEMLRAEELPEKINIVEGAAFAIDVQGDFVYPAEAPKDEKCEHTNKQSDTTKKAKNSDSSSTGSSATSDATLQIESELKQAEEPHSRPFALRNIDLQVPHGALVCIVGRVGTGKSSLLLGLLNEMQQTRGHVKFGGSVSYVPQQAWVQSGTVRDNILFGSSAAEADLDRLNMIVDACALRPDVEMWEDGILAMIGEKGITLSGGQRARLCVARACYEESQTILLDDPLSAVDAHVGHQLMECIISGPLANRTRSLITHSLDCLPKADLVLVMDRDENNDGRIIQQGTYQELLAEEGVFKTLIEEFGTVSDVASNNDDTTASEQITEKAKVEAIVNDSDQKDDKKGAKLMLDEERNTGAVKWHVYRDYAKDVGSWGFVIGILGMHVMAQVCQVGNSLFLGFWAGDELGLRMGEYMAIYAGFGGAIAIFVFAAIFWTIMSGMKASFTMFNGAWKHVMSAPTSWHDRTPQGRVISRLSKDVSATDDQVALWFDQFLGYVLAVFGVMGLVIYTYPYLGLIFIPLALYFYIAAAFYSHVYSAFSEQLHGLLVIRAFGQQKIFQHRMQQALDSQNRASVLRQAMARWVLVRMSTVSALIVLLVGIFGVLFRNSVSAAKLGVVLTYAMSTASILTQLIPTWARLEQEMNSVERLQYYNRLELEGAASLPTDPKLEEWPSQGGVSFQEVQLRYRSELPLVLKGVTFDIKPGEKVGIIGRTGAGKSSIVQALFRTVELASGSIEIDGLDLSKIGLETLRSRLAIIPQDAFLFNGTVRENVDPEGKRTDAELNDALNLINGSSSASQSLREKFKLDGPVLSDGSNFSAGEKRLLALIRALVRGCKVIVLDEATSSVDPETDSLIQKIIQTEFSHVTLISIAHRLQTICFYDRVLCLEAGQVAEYDTPLALFDNPSSIFRSLCNKKSIHREDILHIQSEAAGATRLVQPA